MGPPPATGLAALGLLDYALHTFAAALQGVVAARVSAEVPSLSPSAPTGNVATFSLLHLPFTSGVEVDGYLPPILEVVAQGNGIMEGLSTLNQSLMRGLTSCCRIFGVMAPFSVSLPLIVFFKK